MKKLLLLSLLFAFTVIYAQPTIEWQKSLGGTGSDQAQSIQQTTDGGYIVAGYTNSNDGDVSGSHGDNDFWVVKLTSLGVIEWQKPLGGTGPDWSISIQQTTDGGYIVAGSSLSNNGDVSVNLGSIDTWVVKLTPLGVIEWQKSLGGTNIDELFSIQQTTDGGYIISGESFSNDGDVSGNHGGFDSWVVKLTPLGSIEWQKSLGGTNDDYGTSIKQTIDGGYIVAGGTNSNNGDVSGNHGGTDAWVVKLSSLGNIQWQQALGGTGDDYASSIIQTTDGGYILAGGTNSNNGDVSGSYGDWDSWVVKLSPLGTITWQKPFRGTAQDYAYSIQQTADGGYIVAGFTVSDDGDVSGYHGGTEGGDGWLVKLNNIGSIEWQKCLGGTSSESISSIQQTTDGGCIVALTTQSNDGDVSGNHGNTDLWVVKLSNTLGINEVTAGSQFSIYPNPAINEINVNIDSTILGSQYTIYDPSGRTVMTGKLTVENSSIDISDLSKGVYVFSLGDKYKGIKIVKE